MRSNKPFQIGNLLDRSEASRLLSRARALGELDALVHGLIPSPLNGHCRVLAMRDDTLIVAADSPVWAARLRYQTSQLVKQLAGVSSVNLRTIQVRVRPSGPRLTGHAFAQARPALSRRNSMVLTQAARSVSDAGLKAALLRLAARQGRTVRQRPAEEGSS
jgi:hypothetical protein